MKKNESELDAIIQVITYQPVHWGEWDQTRIEKLLKDTLDVAKDLRQTRRDMKHLVEYLEAKGDWEEGTAGCANCVRIRDTYYAG